MSLAAMKKKQRHTKGVNIGHRPTWTAPLYNVGYGGNKHIKDSKSTISYEQYTHRLRLGKHCNRGDCTNEIVVDHNKKPHFADKTAEHRIEILTTYHLKDEHVEKLKHKEKVVLDGCNNHALNILGDDSDMVKTAEHVLKKRKACLIGKPSKIESVDEFEEITTDNSLFFVVTGRGSILANMDVKVLVNDGSDHLKELEAGSIKTSNAGIASVEIDLKSNGIDENDINYYILKLVPTDESVNTQRFDGEARETKLVLEYFAKIDPSQMNAADTSDGLQIAGGDDAGDADFEITPVTNLIYTIFTICEQISLGRWEPTNERCEKSLCFLWSPRESNVPNDNAEEVAKFGAV